MIGCGAKRLKGLLMMVFFSYCLEHNLDSKVYYLHSTDDGEPSEEAHGASNSWQHVHKLGCSVFGDYVKSRGVKVNSDKLQIKIHVILYEWDVFVLYNLIETES